MNEIQENIDYRLLTAKEYSEGLEDINKKEYLFIINLNKGQDVKQMYFEVLNHDPVALILVKTYLNDLYSSYWDSVEFVGYKKS